MDSDVKHQQNCEICTNAYDNGRIPKFLSCFHTFCTPCLKNLETNFSIQCPLCRKETVVGEKGAAELQTNFYILQVKSPPSENLQEKKRKDELKFCTVCKRSATAICSSVNHNIIDLVKDAVSGPMHLQILTLTCKTHWTAALNKRREVQTALGAVQKAINETNQQLNRIQKENNRLMSELQTTINATNDAKSPKADPEQMMEFLEKFGNFTEKAEQQMKEASTLSGACQSIRSSKMSADLKAADGSTSKLLESVQLGFEPEGTGDDLATCVSVLSYLALSMRHSTELSSLNVKETSQPNEPNKNVQSKKTKEKKPFDQNKKTKKEIPAPQGAKVKNQPTNPQIPKKSHQDTEAKKGAEGKKGTEGKKGPKEGPRAAFVPPLDISSPPPAISPAFNSIPPHLMKKRCYFSLSVNGKFYGKIVFDLRPDVAPMMCAKFVHFCINRQGPSYVGNLIHGAKPKEKIMGGRLAGTEELYLADRSPLKRTRGAIFMRLKQDLTKTHCFIVSSEFVIHLQDHKNQSRETTVFGSVIDGLAVCDAISHLDLTKDIVNISDAGAIF